MANNSAQFNLGIKTSADLSGINQIKKALADIKSPKLLEGFDKSEIYDITRAATTLETALDAAFDPKINTVNINRFNKVLKDSNIDIRDIQASLSLVGMEGQEAFMKMSTQLFNMNTVVKQSHTMLNNLAKTIGNTVRYQAINMALQGITNGVSQAYGYVKNLDKSLNNIQVVTEKNAASMRNFAVEANKAAQSLGAKTTDYTDASLIYYQQGLSDQEVQGRTDTTMKMANVLGASADEVSQYMTAIWNNFDDGSKSLEYYGDVITSLGAKTASSAEEIAQGLEKFASVAETTGLSYEYATAALATVTAETRQSADVVGTSFKTLFARIQDLELGDEGAVSVGKYAQALQAVGINILDANGALEDMDGILDEMGSKWKTLNSEQQMALAQNVGGTRQYPQLISLMENWDKVKENVENATNATGTLEDKQAIYMESTAAHLKTMSAAWENFYDSLMSSDNVNSLADIGTVLGNSLATVSDSIGGIIPLLSMLGATGVRAFSTQLAQSIQVSYSNLKLMKDETISFETHAQELKSMFGDQSWLASFGFAGTDTEVMKSYFNDLVSFYGEISQYKDIMSQKDIDAFNNILKQKEALGQVKMELEAQTEEWREINEVTGIASKAIGADASTEQARVKIQQLTEAYVEFDKMFDQIVIDTQTDLSKSGTEQLINKLNEYIQKLKDAGAETTQLGNRLREVFSNANGIKIDNDLKIIPDSGEVELAAETVHKIESEFINTHGAAVQAAQGVQTLTNQTKILTPSVEEAGEALKNRLSFTQITDQTLKMIGAIGQLAMAFSMLKNLGNIWNNEDLSTGEKIIQTMINLSMIVPMISSGITGLIKSRKLLLSEIYKDIIAEKIDNAEKAKGAALSSSRVAAITSETIAHKSLTAALYEQVAGLLAVEVAGAPLWAVLGVATVAIGTVTAATYAAVKAYNADADAARETAEATKQLREENEKLKSSYGELITSIEGYENARNAIDDLAYGTTEWKTAIEETNEKAVELLNTYEDLTYTRDKNGVIHLVNLDEVRQAKKEALELSNQITNANSIVANNAKLKSEQTNLSRNKNLKDLQLNSNEIDKLANALKSGTQEDLRQIANEWMDSRYTDTYQYTGSRSEKIQEFIDSVTNSKDAFDDYAKTLQQVETANQLAAEEIANSALTTQKWFNELSPSIQAQLVSIAAGEVNTGEYTKEEQDEAIIRRHQAQFERGEFGGVEAEARISSTLLNKSDIEEYAKANGYNLTNDLNQNSQWEKTISFVEGKVSTEVIKAWLANQDKITKDSQDITAAAFEEKNRLKELDIPALKAPLQKTAEQVEALEKKYTSLNKVLENISNNLNITKDEYANLSKDGQAYFAKMADGTYQLIGDAEEFKNQIQKDKDKDTQDRIDSNLKVLNDRDNQKYNGLYGSSQKIDTEKGLFGRTYYDGSELRQYGNDYFDANLAQERLSFLTESGLLNAERAQGYQEQLDFISKHITDNIIDYGSMTEKEGAAFSKAMENFSKDFDSFINEINDAHQFVEDATKDLNEAKQQRAFEVISFNELKDLKNNGQVSVEEAQNATFKVTDNVAQKYGLDASVIENAAKALADQNEALKENKMLLYDVAIQQARNEKGTHELISIYDKFTKQAKKGKQTFEDFKEAITNAEGFSGFTKTLATVRESLANILNVDASDISENFIKDNFDKIQKYIETKDPEIRNQIYDTLSQAFAEEQIIKIKAELDPVAKSNVEAALTELSNIEIDPAELEVKLNDLDFQSKFPALMQLIEQDATAAQAILDKLGYDAEIVPESKQIQIPLPPNSDGSISHTTETVTWFKIVPKNHSTVSTEQVETPSGGGGGSKKSDKKSPNEYWEEFDEHYDLNQDIDTASKKLKNLQKKSSGMHGKELAANLKEQNALLEKQKQGYEKLIAAKKEKMKVLQQEINGDEILAKLGKEVAIEFDESGQITNYAEATKAAYEKYLAAYAAANGAEKDAVLKEYEHYKKLLEEYSVVLDEIDDLNNDIEDAEYQRIENNFKAWEAEIKAQLDLENAKQDWYKFLRKMNTDFRLQYMDPYQATFGMVEQAQSIADEIGINIGAMEDIQAEINKFNEGGKSDMFHSLSEAQETMGQYLDQMMEAGEELYDLAEEAWDLYLQLIDEIADQFEDIIKKFERIDESIQHNIRLTELLYGDESYDKLSRLYEAKVYNDALELDSYRQQVAFWEKETQIAKQLNGEESEDYYKMYNYWQEAIANLESQIERAVEDLQAQIENKIDSLFSNIEKSLTKGWGYEAILDEWSSAKDAMEGNYDEIERLYQLQTLQNQWNDLLKDTGTVKTQQKLAEVMEYQLDLLNNKAVLTEKDIELAQKELEVAKAQAALEDAQYNKQAMKLVRGTDGNWSYQYVADADEVSKKQQEALDAQNEMYESAKDSLADTLESMMSMIKDYNEQITELTKQWYKEEDPTNKAALEAQIAGLRERLTETAANSLDEINFLSDKLGKSSSSLLYSLYNSGDLSTFNSEMLDFVGNMLDEGVNSWTDFSSAASDSFHTIAVEGKELAEKLSGLFGDNTQLSQFMNNLYAGAGIPTGIGSNRGENQALLSVLSNSLGQMLLPSADDLNPLVDTYWNTIGELTGYAGYDFTNIDKAIEKNVNATYELRDDTEQLVVKATQQLTYMQALTSMINSILNNVKPAMFEAGNMALNAMGAEGNLYEEAQENQNAMIGEAIGVANGYLAEMRRKGTSKTPVDELAINMLRNSDAGAGYTGGWSGSSIGTTSISTLPDLNYDTYIKGLTSSIGSALQTSVATMVADITKAIAPVKTSTINTDNSIIIQNLEANFPNADDVATIQEAILSLPNIVSQYVNR